MNACIIARSPAGLSVDLEIRPHSIKGLMASSTLDLRPASLVALIEKESGDSKMVWTVYLTGELEGPANDLTRMAKSRRLFHPGHKDNFWPCVRGLRVCQLMMQWDADTILTSA